MTPLIFGATFRIGAKLLRTQSGKNHVKMSSAMILGDATNIDNPPKKLKTNSPTLKFTKLSEFAAAPTKGSPLSAGFDLRSARDTVVPARGQVLVPTDLKIAVPDGHYGRIAPRSGLAHHNSIDVGAGVIDQDYRGPVGVILFNFSDTDFGIKTGERIAQIICEKISYPELQECQSLDNTERGEDGFGSTGKK